MSGKSGTGKSAIMGIIAKALRDANMVEKISIDDEDFSPVNVEYYIKRAEKIDILAPKKIDITIQQKQEKL